MVGQFIAFVSNYFIRKTLSVLLIFHLQFLYRSMDLLHTQSAAAINMVLFDLIGVVCQIVFINPQHITLSIPYILCQSMSRRSFYMLAYPVTQSIILKAGI